ncbi:DegV family protein [Chloroflexota bacterium]
MTDSTADLPQSVVAQLGITVVPLHVFFGDEAYEDGVTISKDEFYQKLTAPGALTPTTSAPSAGAFAAAYELAGHDADGVVSIHLSSELSGTHASALVGRSQSVVSSRVEVVDSGTVSAALGLLVIEAATMAREGASVAEIVEVVRDCIPHTWFFGALGTLEYLRRGGRIGRAAAFLGSMLQVKPIIGFHDGAIYPIERARGRARALERVRRLIADYGSMARVAVGHTTDEDGMRSVEDFVKEYAPDLPIGHFQCGATIGAYLGPDAFGLALIQKPA